MGDASLQSAVRMKTLTILGSTGSIGTNTLDVVYAMAAGRNTDLLASQILEFRPKAVVTNGGVDALAERLQALGLPRSEWPEIGAGPAALVAISTAPQVDTVVSAIVGVAGLEATYEAAVVGKRIGLANKEVLVS